MVSGDLAMTVRKLESYIALYIKLYKFQASEQSYIVALEALTKLRDLGYPGLVVSFWPVRYIEVLC